jgi:hypothetical protein
MKEEWCSYELLLLEKCGLLVKLVHECLGGMKFHCDIPCVAMGVPF